MDFRSKLAIAIGSKGYHRLPDDGRSASQFRLNLRCGGERLINKFYKNDLFNATHLCERRTGSCISSVEDIAIPAISKYNGRLLIRVRPDHNSFVATLSTGPMKSIWLNLMRTRIL